MGNLQNTNSVIDSTATSHIKTTSVNDIAIENMVIVKMDEKSEHIISSELEQKEEKKIVTLKPLIGGIDDKSLMEYDQFHAEVDYNDTFMFDSDHEALINPPRLCMSAFKVQVNLDILYNHNLNKGSFTISKLGHYLSKIVLGLKVKSSDSNKNMCMLRYKLFEEFTMRIPDITTIVWLDATLLECLEDLLYSSEYKKSISKMCKNGDFIYNIDIYENLKGCFPNTIIKKNDIVCSVSGLNPILKNDNTYNVSATASHMHYKTSEDITMEKIKYVKVEPWMRLTPSLEKITNNTEFSHNFILLNPKGMIRSIIFVVKTEDTYLEVDTFSIKVNDNVLLSGSGAYLKNLMSYDYNMNPNHHVYCYRITDQNDGLVNVGNMTLDIKLAEKSKELPEIKLYILKDNIIEINNIEGGTCKLLY